MTSPPRPASYPHTCWPVFFLPLLLSLLLLLLLLRMLLLLSLLCLKLLLRLPLLLPWRLLLLQLLLPLLPLSLLPLSLPLHLPRRRRRLLLLTCCSAPGVSHSARVCSCAGCSCARNWALAKNSPAPPSVACPMASSLGHMRE